MSNGEIATVGPLGRGAAQAQYQTGNILVAQAGGKPSPQAVSMDKRHDQYVFTIAYQDDPMEAVFNQFGKGFKAYLMKVQGRSEEEANRILARIVKGIKQACHGQKFTFNIDRMEPGDTVKIDRNGVALTITITRKEEELPFYWNGAEGGGGKMHCFCAPRKEKTSSVQKTCNDVLPKLPRYAIKPYPTPLKDKIMSGPPAVAWEAFQIAYDLKTPWRAASSMLQKIVTEAKTDTATLARLRARGGTLAKLSASKVRGYWFNMGVLAYLQAKLEQDNLARIAQWLKGEVTSPKPPVPIAQPTVGLTREKGPPGDGDASPVREEDVVAEAPLRSRGQQLVNEFLPGLSGRQRPSRVFQGQLAIARVAKLDSRVADEEEITREVRHPSRFYRVRMSYNNLSPEEKEAMGILHAAIQDEILPLVSGSNAPVPKGIVPKWMGSAFYSPSYKVPAEKIDAQYFEAHAKQWATLLVKRLDAHPASAAALRILYEEQYQSSYLDPVPAAYRAIFDERPGTPDSTIVSLDFPAGTSHRSREVLVRYEHLMTLLDLAATDDGRRILRFAAALQKEEISIWDVDLSAYQRFLNYALWERAERSLGGIKTDIESLFGRRFSDRPSDEQHLLQWVAAYIEAGDSAQTMFANLFPDGFAPPYTQFAFTDLGTKPEESAKLGSRSFFYEICGAATSLEGQARILSRRSSLGELNYSEKNFLSIVASRIQRKDAAVAKDRAHVPNGVFTNKLRVAKILRMAVYKALKQVEAESPSSIAVAD